MVQAFMWIPLDKPPTQKPLQSKYTPSWQWHSLMAVVTQKDNAACHSAKLSQEWPEEHEKELKVLSWHPNSPGPNPIHRTYQKTSDPWRPHLGIHQGMDYWGCPVVSGTRTLAVGAMDAQSLWNLGTLEARSMPWAWHPPLAIPEQFLQCSRVHCPAGGPPPPGNAVAIRVFTLSATVFGLNGACQVLSTWTPDPMFPSRTMHYHKMTSNIHLTSQCFECCGWLLYISEVRLNITNTYFG